MLSDSLKSQRTEKTGNDVCNFISVICHFHPTFFSFFLSLSFSCCITFSQTKKGGGLKYANRIIEVHLSCLI